MGLINLNAGHHAFVSAVPADVNAALAELATVYLHLSNINGLLNVTLANNQMKAAQSEAGHQIKQGVAEAFGEALAGTGQILAGGLAVYSSTKYISELNAYKPFDQQMENATAYKEAIKGRAPNVGARDQNLPIKNKLARDAQFWRKKTGR